MNRIHIETPLTEEKLIKLNAGDVIYITGYIYTARDAAHMKIIEAINKNEDLPIDLNDEIIYYAGPTPPRPENISGAFGPTTSSRMDEMTVPLLEKGLKGMIGKGMRSEKVVEGIIKNKAVYFAAIGGAGALISNSIKNIEIVAYDELGTEAIRKLIVEEFPVVVAIDSKGHNIYEIEKNKYKK